MEWSLLQREVFSLLLPFHLSSKSPVSQAVLRRLWAGSPGLVVEALVEYVAQDGGNLPRVLDICQDLQVCVCLHLRVCSETGLMVEALLEYVAQDGCKLAARAGHLPGLAGAYVWVCGCVSRCGWQRDCYHRPCSSRETRLSLLLSFTGLSRPS